MTEGARPQIVVAEDDPATRALIQRQLEDAGYAVSACVDGRAALEAIKAAGGGILVADWAMPEMDGIELCQAVRQLEEMQALGRVHVILLTAHDSKEKTIEGLEAGANDYLTKPYHPGELLARLRVGERMLALQEELLQRTIEFQKANSRLAILTRQLNAAANTDALTGLPNRRCLFDRLDDLWRLSEERRQPLSCVMIDIDRFKKTNDAHGHAAGDVVLQHVATLIRQTARAYDVCGRVGGEEFIVLCPATPGQAAADLADRIRQAVASSPVVYDGHSIPASVSCGAAERHAAMRRPDDLIRTADELLYAAKEHGRNQTWIPTEEGRARFVSETAD